VESMEVKLGINGWISREYGEFKFQKAIEQCAARESTSYSACHSNSVSDVDRPIRFHIHMNPRPRDRIRIVG
jgi:hypothetical protein